VRVLLEMVMGIEMVMGVMLGENNSDVMTPVTYTDPFPPCFLTPTHSCGDWHGGSGGCTDRQRVRRAVGEAGSQGTKVYG
jgi:hypothetical protein